MPKEISALTAVISRSAGAIPGFILFPCAMNPYMPACGTGSDVSDGENQNGKSFRNSLIPPCSNFLRLQNKNNEKAHITNIPLQVSSHGDSTEVQKEKEKEIKVMKRWRKYALCLFCALCMAVLAGCGNNNDGGSTGKKEDTAQENGNRQDDAAADDKESGSDAADNGSARTDQNKNNGTNGGTGNGIIAGKNAAGDDKTGNHATDNDVENGVTGDSAAADDAAEKKNQEDNLTDNSLAGDTDADDLADGSDDSAIIGTDENGTEKSFVNSVTDHDNTEDGNRGDNDADNENKNGETGSGGVLGNAADSLLEGVGDAGKDVIDGVGNAGKNVIDGIEGAGDALTGNGTDAQ